MSPEAMEQDNVTRVDRTVWLTANHARSLSKKLKGYRWVPVTPDHSVDILPIKSLATRDHRERRKSATAGLEVNTATPSLPVTTSTKLTQPSPRVTQSKKRKTVPEAAPKESPISDEQRKKEEHLRTLELRLQYLREHQSRLNSEITATHGSANKKKTPPKPKAVSTKMKAESISAPIIINDDGDIPAPQVKPIHHPASVAIASTIPPSPSTTTPAHIAASPNYAINPPATPGGTIITTSKGRNVKAPTHYIASEAVTLTAELRRCLTMLNNLMNNKAQMKIFNLPVNYSDPNKPYYAPRYLETIEGMPMDLGTVRSNLTSGLYKNLEEVVHDIRLIWRNAQIYNPADSWIHQTAQQLSLITDSEVTKIYEKLEQEKLRKLQRKQPGSASQAIVGATLSDGSAIISQMADRIAALESQLVSKGNGREPSDSDSDYDDDEDYPKKKKKRPSSSANRKSVGSASNSGISTSLKNRPMTQREKQLLKDNIFKLPQTKLTPIIEIISKNRGKSDDASKDDEIEIDIDKVDVPTLRELQDYVKKALNSIRRKPAVMKKRSFGQLGTSPMAHSGQSTPSASPRVCASPPGTANSFQQSPNRLHMDTSPVSSHLNDAPSPLTRNFSSDTRLVYSDSDSSSDSSDSSDSDSDSLTSARLHPSSHNQNQQQNASNAPLLTVGDEEDEGDMDVSDVTWSTVENDSVANPNGNGAASNPPKDTSSAAIESSSRLLWNDFQSKDADLKAKARQREEADVRKIAEMTAKQAAEQVELYKAAEERKRTADLLAAAQQKEKERLDAEKQKAIEAEREAARRAREEAAKEAGTVVENTDLMEAFERFENR